MPPSLAAGKVFSNNTNTPPESINFTSSKSEKHTKRTRMEPPPKISEETLNILPRAYAIEIAPFPHILKRYFRIWKR